MANIVTNGGFETGDFTGWVQSGNTGFTGVCSGGCAFSGTYGAEFGPVGSEGFITQTLATTPGAGYDLSFMLRNGGSDTSNLFELWWDGALIYSEGNVGSYGWTSYAFPSLIASGSSTDLAFGFRNDPNWYDLDNVSATLIPEPSTLLLVGLGAIALPLLRRRK